MTDEVLTTVEGGVGRIRLNRPRAIHALTRPMCSAMIEAVQAWRADPAVEAVLIDHAEGRGFCAGGDVVALAKDAVQARAFFHEEYRLNHLLFTYAKPIVSVLDGVVMGGGVGIGLPARYRIATERTVFAMPEATIGLFPDVGGGWYLSRLPGRLGHYLALTAARLSGADCAAVGLATHFVQSARIEALKATLIAEGPDALERFAGDAGDAAIVARQSGIDRLFAGATLEAIDDALAADPAEWAQDTLATLRAKSPQACKVALRQLAESALLTDFADEMRMEYRIAARVCQRHDFIEGVRALLVDKDHAPRWDPATAAGVTDHLLDTIFAPLPADEEWAPLRR
jgi:enoyl-CoA hydratase